MIYHLRPKTPPISRRSGPQFADYNRTIHDAQRALCGGEITNQDSVLSKGVERKLKAGTLCLKWTRMSDAVVFEACPACVVIGKGN